MTAMSRIFLFLTLIQYSYPNKRADSAVCVGADGILIEVLLLIVLISFCSLKFAIFVVGFKKQTWLKS